MGWNLFLSSQQKGSGPILVWEPAERLKLNLVLSCPAGKHPSASVSARPATQDFLIFVVVLMLITESPWNLWPHEAPGEAML